MSYLDRKLAEDTDPELVEFRQHLNHGKPDSSQERAAASVAADIDAELSRRAGLTR